MHRCYLYAFAYHMFRATCHKPKYVIIALQNLMTYDAMHPKIADVVNAMSSISPLGREGASIFPDRFLEGVNKYQEQRNGMGGSLDAKLHTGPELPALMHVMHAFDEFNGTDHGQIRDPIRPSLLNGAERLRQRFKSTLGTDLTTHSSLNHYWHTGTPVNAEVGDPRRKMGKRSHKWLWAVAEGTSGG